jgi:hypothetical protein
MPSPSLGLSMWQGRFCHVPSLFPQVLVSWLLAKAASESDGKPFARELKR